MYWSDYVNGNEVAKSLHKIYANKLKQIIRLAKKLYFDKQAAIPSTWLSQNLESLARITSKKINQ